MNDRGNSSAKLRRDVIYLLKWEIGNSIEFRAATRAPFCSEAAEYGECGCANWRCQGMAASGATNPLELPAPEENVGDESCQKSFMPMQAQDGKRETRDQEQRKGDPVPLQGVHFASPHRAETFRFLLCLGLSG
jgi:hypothetical protein